MMMLKYWEALREAVPLEFRSPLSCQVSLRELWQNPLHEGTGITIGAVAMQRMETRNLSPLPWLTTMKRILVMLNL